MIPATIVFTKDVAFDLHRVDEQRSVILTIVSSLAKTGQSYEVELELDGPFAAMKFSNGRTAYLVDTQSFEIVAGDLNTRFVKFAASID